MSRAASTTGRRQGFSRGASAEFSPAAPVSSDLGWLHKLNRGKDRWKAGFTYQCECGEILSDGFSFRVHVRESHDSLDYEGHLKGKMTPKGWIRILRQCQTEAEKEAVFALISSLDLKPEVEAALIR